MIVELLVVRQTEKAVYVRQDDNTEPFWLPKSQIQLSDKDYADIGLKATFDVPEWLAYEHGILEQNNEEGQSFDEVMAEIGDIPM